MEKVGLGLLLKVHNMSDLMGDGAGRTGPVVEGS